MNSSINSSLQEEMERVREDFARKWEKVWVFFYIVPGVTLLLNSLLVTFFLKGMKRKLLSRKRHILMLNLSIGDIFTSMSNMVMATGAMDFDKPLSVLYIYIYYFNVYIGFTLAILCYGTLLIYQYIGLN